jgi:hypothetical protein
MYEYLKVHPEVYFSPIKDAYFFGQDLKRFDSGHVFMNAQEYRELFEACGKARVVGDASVAYLYSKSAAEEILHFSPDARILIMLRNPVEAIHSLYHDNLYTQREQLPSLAAALAVEEKRKALAGQDDKVHFWQFYSDVYSYPDQVRRYFDHFGRDCVHVILFDDFSRDPRGEYLKMAEFLGIDTSIEPEYRVINASKKAKSAKLMELVRTPPKPLKRLFRLLLPNRHSRSILKKKIKVWNSNYSSKPPLDEAVKEQILTAKAGEIRELGTLLGRDLSLWLR